MAIRTQQPVSGFIASEPELSDTAKGDARFYARIRQEHSRREADGSFTELEPTFHDLVAYRANAERAHERPAKGDSFVAEGYAHTFEHERDGQTVESEEFVAKKIGHSLARTNYEDRPQPPGTSRHRTRNPNPRTPDERDPQGPGKRLPGVGALDGRMTDNRDMAPEPDEPEPDDTWKQRD